MYKTKHAAPRKWRINKIAVMAAAIVVVILVSIGGTLAWSAHQSNPVQNTFTPGTADIDIHEKVENDIKEEVTVRNQGKSPVYVRVAVVINSLDENGNIIFGETPDFVLNKKNWTQLNDGYYYYNGILAPGDSTANLLNESFHLAQGNKKYEMDILAEAIQAGGTTPDGTPAVEDAWKATYENGTWKPVQQKP